MSPNTGPWLVVIDDDPQTARILRSHTEVEMLRADAARFTDGSVGITHVPVAQALEAGSLVEAVRRINREWLLISDRLGAAVSPGLLSTFTDALVDARDAVEKAERES